MMNQIKNMNKSKSNKNFTSNLLHGRSKSTANLSNLGVNQAFWEASIYAKYRKNVKNNNKIILNKQKYNFNPSLMKTNHNSSIVFQSVQDNNLTSNNNFELQNPKVTESYTKSNFENASVKKKVFSFNMKI